MNTSLPLSIFWLVSAALPDALRQLPALTPPPNGWSRLSARLDAESRLRRRQRWVTGLALAASVLVAVVLLRPQALLAPTAESGEVAALQARSQALEQQLASLRDSTDVWDGALALTTARLQRSVALVDAQLAEADPQTDSSASVARPRHPEGVAALWRNRVDLLSQLVQTHETATLVRDSAAAADSLRVGAQLDPAPETASQEL